MLNYDFRCENLAFFIYSFLTAKKKRVTYKFSNESLKSCKIFLIPSKFSRIDINIFNTKRSHSHGSCLARFSKFSVSHTHSPSLDVEPAKLCLQSQNLSYCLITAHDQEIKDFSMIRGNRLELKFLQSQTKREVTQTGQSLGRWSLQCHQVLGEWNTSSNVSHSQACSRWF